MSETRAPMDLTLPNVGPGPSPLSLAALAKSNDFVVVFLQRDHFCTNCRRQVQDVAERAAEFSDLGAEPVSVVPEAVDTVREWQAAYDLPFPLLADPEAAAGAAFDQPVRFGVLGDWSDFLGRMPQVVIVDGRAERAEVAWSHAGRSTFDRPSIDEVLAVLADLGESPP